MIMELKMSSKKIAMLIICLVMLFNIISVPVNIYAASSYTQEVKSGIDTFPSKYQTYLNKLHEQHPNWTFDSYYTDISWNELLANETDHGHNRVIYTAEDSWKCDCGNVASGYACASSGIIAYFLDPRNFLDDVSVFQFLETSYNENVHNLAGVEKAVKNTFLDNRVTFNLNGNEVTMSYAEIILEAAKQSNMSPYTIRTKIIQEVGTKGSGSVSGTYSGYEGYYNFYNYGAYDSGNAIANGLNYAKNAGWNNQYTAIVEGAKLLASAYTNAGQNTAYFYKWDVVGDSILRAGQSQTFYSSRYFFRHQYMTNIQDPRSQSKTLFNLYASSGILDGNLNFVIPIYKDMPTSPVSLPGEFNSQVDDDTLIYYVADSDGINVRSNPGTTSSRICSIPKDTKIIVLEKGTTKVTGYIWYKVELPSGVVGYVASDYIAYYSGKEFDNNEEIENPVVEPDEPDEPTLTLSPNVKLDAEKSLIYVTPETSGNIISAVLNISECQISNLSNENIDSSTLVGTGYKFLDNNNNKVYTIIKLGDVNGDGESDAIDLLLLKRSILGTIELNDNQKMAIDLNKDNSVDAIDLLLQKRHLLKTKLISL